MCNTWRALDHFYLAFFELHIHGVTSIKPFKEKSII